MSIPQPIPSEDSQKRTLLFWFALILFLSIAFTLNRSQVIRVQSDLFSRWYAGRMLLENGRNLYDRANGAESIVYKALPTTPLEASFFYPAQLILLLFPLLWLPFQWAHLLWTVCVQLFFFLGIWNLTLATGWPARANQILVFFLLALFFIPAIQQIIWSQFDTIGVLVLGMCYRELVRGRYFIAGLWACGFTFKPQGTVFLLTFILLWALFDRRRWKYFIGFGVGCLSLWAITEILQPGWLGDFLATLREYQKLPYQIQSVLDSIWNPGQVLSILIVLLAIGLVLINRKADPGSPGFIGITLLGLCISWLVIPVIGMLYLVLLPAGLILLFSALERFDARLYRGAVIIFAILYILGYVGFIIGLAIHAIPGLHIRLAELFYKGLVPIFLMGFAGWLSIKKPLKIRAGQIGQV